MSTIKSEAKTKKIESFLPRIWYFAHQQLGRFYTCGKTTTNLSVNCCFCHKRVNKEWPLMSSLPTRLKSYPQPKPSLLKNSARKSQKFMTRKFNLSQATSSTSRSSAKPMPPYCQTLSESLFMTQFRSTSNSSRLSVTSQSASSRKLLLSSAKIPLTMNSRMRSWSSRWTSEKVRSFTRTRWDSSRTNWWKFSMNSSRSRTNCPVHKVFYVKWTRWHYHRWFFRTKNTAQRWPNCLLF